MLPLHNRANAKIALLQGALEAIYPDQNRIPRSENELMPANSLPLAVNDRSIDRIVMNLKYNVDKIMIVFTLKGVRTLNPFKL